ncbi:serine endoprotease [Anatilimnocola aggregata]|uniref:Serine endoprotease n=1 Tax=Anatilimnocola aggregata TaxID=2528021 RepID=A0A517YHY0_9BACT|nr:PDZ domain-containing protein [Anatilimnocola aggregata]QDU29828.1 serine endoprotease [Anatilimnocola aggregata]
MRRTLLQRWCSAVAMGMVPALVLGQFSSLTAAEPSTIAIAPTVELNRLVLDLDADAYPVRERATARLIEAGQAAIELLAPAVLSDSPEVSWRASVVLQRIAAHGDEETVNHVAAALGKLNSKRPVLVEVMRDIKVQQLKLRHTRAIVKIRTLGGHLTGQWQDQSLDTAPPPTAAEVVDLDVAPAVAIEPIPIVEVAPPRDLDALPPPRGLIGAIARILAPVEKPAAEPPAADEPPLEVRPLEVAPDAIPLDIIPTAPNIEVPVPAAPAIAAADLPKLEEPAEASDPAADLEAALLELAPLEGIAVEPAFDVVIGGGMVGAVDLFEGDLSGEGNDYAELVINRTFRGTDADLALLKDIPELYNLSITDAKLTDKTLEHIAALPKLTTLNVQGTPFTSAALRNLRNKRPALSIICRSSAMLGINAQLEGPCVLSSVFFRSGAHDAGLKDGDEIIAVAGEKVRDFSDLTISVYPRRPGEKLNVQYRRDGEEHNVDVTLKPRVVPEVTE